MPRKYRNQPTTYNGSEYDSTAEADYARQLDERKAGGEVLAWSRQQAVILIPAHVDPSGAKVASLAYLLDFVVELADGWTELVDVKGYATPVWRLKWKLLSYQLAQGQHRDRWGERVRLVVARKPRKPRKARKARTKSAPASAPEPAPARSKQERMTAAEYRAWKRREL